MPAAIDLTGHKYNRLTVLHEVPHKHGNKKWKCLCDCGNTTEVYGNKLRGGTTKSCGCARKETLLTHGESRTPLSRTWRNIRQRCTNPSATGYENYGGRGITMCEEWLGNFVAFRDWAKANGYDESLSIERINNEEGYSPTNCEWISISDQWKNKRKRHDSKQ